MKSPPVEEDFFESEKFYTIEDVTTGPVFDHVLLSEKIIYPSLAKRQQKEGLVLLRLYISASGEIVKIVVEENPGYGFAEAAVRAFSSLRVQPAQLRGEPIGVTLLFPINFNLT